VAPDVDTSPDVSLDPNLVEQQLLADTLERERSAMDLRELLAEVLIGAGFALAAAAIWWLDPPHAFALLPTALCVAVMALSMLVRFETPLGFTVPTQLAFVPLLFAAPVAVVPVAVVVALWLARAYDLASRRIPPSRLLKAPGNAWFSIGPVIVFAVAGTTPRHSGLPLLLLALLAEFGLDTLVATVRTVLERGASLRDQVRESWVYGIDAALSGVGLAVAQDLHRSPAIVLVLLPLLGLLQLFARERHRRLEGLIELGNAYRGTALVLGDVVEADDGYTGEHCKSVVALALAVADQLGLDAASRRNLEFGALLHDVGKIAIPKEIINKAGKLDPAEWTLIKTHTLEGQAMLERVGGFMREVGLIVRSHHERWDGTGYPDGLAGEAIPLEARIIACCDSWNAMRTDRAYRKALPHETAVRELMAHSGTQFDPRIVEALLRLVQTDLSTEPAAVLTPLSQAA
jgi:putative nucleotidyltransferase with HDIG domain